VAYFSFLGKGQLKGRLIDLATSDAGKINLSCVVRYAFWCIDILESMMFIANMNNYDLTFYTDQLYRNIPTSFR